MRSRRPKGIGKEEGPASGNRAGNQKRKSGKCRDRSGLFGNVEKREKNTKKNNKKKKKKKKRKKKKKKKKKNPEKKKKQKRKKKKKKKQAKKKKTHPKSRPGGEKKGGNRSPIGGIGEEKKGAERNSLTFGSVEKSAETRCPATSVARQELGNTGRRRRETPFLWGERGGKRKGRRVNRGTAIARREANLGGRGAARKDGFGSWPLNSGRRTQGALLARNTSLGGKNLGVERKGWRRVSRGFPTKKVNVK